jgi:hypothetical protein
MSYTSQSALRANMSFQERVTSCVNEQALTFRNDARPEFSYLSEWVIRTGGAGAASVFVPNIAGGPGFGDVEEKDITDGDILAATQAIWPVIGVNYVPADIAR